MHLDAKSESSDVDANAESRFLPLEEDGAKKKELGASRIAYVEEVLSSVLKKALRAKYVARYANFLARRNTGLWHGRERINQEFVAAILGITRPTLQKHLEALQKTKIIVCVGLYSPMKRSAVFQWHPELAEMISDLPTFVDLEEGDIYAPGESNRGAKQDAQACFAAGWSMEDAEAFIQDRIGSTNRRRAYDWVNWVFTGGTTVKAGKNFAAKRAYSIAQQRKHHKAIKTAKTPKK